MYRMGLELLFKDFEQRLVDTDIFSAKLVVICDLDYNDQVQDNDLDGKSLLPLEL